MNSPEYLKENEEYLDKVALETMKTFMLKSKLPEGIPDSVALARISYKQALAMLEVKLSISALSDSVGILVREKRKELNAKEKAGMK